MATIKSPLSDTTSRPGRGGRRVNQGRPKGSKNKPRVATPNETKKRVTDRLVETVDKTEVTPVEVMLETMSLFYRDAKACLANMDAIPADTKDPEQMLARQGWKNMGFARSLEAHEVACDAAPYLHPKLQAVTLASDPKNPLKLALDLVDAASLRKAIRGEEG